METKVNAYIDEVYRELKIYGNFNRETLTKTQYEVDDFVQDCIISVYNSSGLQNWWKTLSQRL